MRFKLGEIVMNKTFKYLLPCVKYYGDEFRDRISSVWKIAVGIGDMALSDKGVNYNNHLFVLIDTSVAKKFFIDFLEWIKGQPMYAIDYPFDDINTGHLHMVVIALPDGCSKPLEALKRSQYSSMYTEKELNTLFPVDKIRVRKVLLKDSSYKPMIVNKLNKIWGTTITAEEYDGEVELQINLEEEFFNYKKYNLV